MRKMWMLTALVLTTALLMGVLGCGSGEDGDGNGVDATLVGVWQFFEAREDGNVIPPGEAIGWEEGMTRTTAEFLNNGNLVIRDYDNTKALVNTENGTWTAQGGVLTLTIDQEVMEFAYVINGNLLTLTSDDEGHENVMRWAKVVNLTGHDAALVRTWVVQSVQVNGANTPIADYFGLPPAAQAMSMQMLADGTLIARPLGAENVILGRTNGTWATGGGELAVTIDGFTMRGSYLANNTSTTLLDEMGRTVHFELAAFAPAGQRAAALLGAWQAASATVNGTPVPMEDFFGWEDDTDRMTIAFFADGTIISVEYAGADVTFADMGTWSSAGGTLTINFPGEDPMVMNFNVVGNTVTVTFTEGGDDVVLTFTRVG